LYGFMHITPLRPKWVLCCATMCPVLVSWYRNTPPLSTLANRKWCGRNSNFNGEIWSCTTHKFRHLLSHSRKTICWCKTSSPVTLLRNFSSQVCSMPTMTQQLELSVTNCTKVLVKYRHHKESLDGIWETVLPEDSEFQRLSYRKCKHTCTVVHRVST
jgi:hypothetical protein